MQPDRPLLRRALHPKQRRYVASVCAAEPTPADAIKKCLAPDETGIGGHVGNCSCGTLTPTFPLAHDTVTVKIGCNNVPDFSVARGGRSRTLCFFLCTYPCCSAFMDVRILPHAIIIKWVLMCTSHNHTFSTLPAESREPCSRPKQCRRSRHGFGKRPGANTRMSNRVLCSMNTSKTRCGAVRSLLPEQEGPCDTASEFPCGVL